MRPVLLEKTNTTENTPKKIAHLLNVQDGKHKIATMYIYFTTVISDQSHALVLSTAREGT